MPRYTAEIRAFGWFELTADDEADAANVAEQLIGKSGVPFGAEFEWCELETLSQNDDDG